MTEKQPTFGERLVGKSSNPSKDSKVDRIKELMAEAADIVHDTSVQRNVDLGGRDEATVAVDSNAVQQIINAQMAAVKAVTWTS